MQLADEGLLDLDATVVTYLPDFGLADSEAARTMTVRQLLCHKAGFEGDIFTDTGTNDDCVQKYVETLKTDPQLFPPGEMFSYNNAGYCVLGRIVEVLRGKPWDQALREHLFTPLGLTHAATDANSAILFRAAVGHLPNPDADGLPGPRPDVVAGEVERAGRGDARHAPPRPARLRPHAPVTAARRKTAPRCCPRRASRPCASGRSRCRRSA